MKQQNHTKDDPSLASTLGHGLAILQHGMDRVIEWGFAKMKEADRAETMEMHNPYMRRAADLGKKTLGFFGRTGEAYYRHYEELKRRRGNTASKL